MLPPFHIPVKAKECRKRPVVDNAEGPVYDWAACPTAMKGDCEMGKADKPKDAAAGSCVRFQPIPLAFNYPTAGQQDETAERARNMPRGRQRFWGIPFKLAPRREAANALRPRKGRGTVVAVGSKATHLCFLHFWEGPPDAKLGDAGGELVGEYVLRYADGQTVTMPVRSRFEIGWQAPPFGAYLYAGVRYEGLAVMNFMSQEARKSIDWGILQTDATRGRINEPCIHALINPRPAEKIESVLMRSTHKSPFGVLGLTLYEGPGHPLRHNARRYFKLDLPDGAQVQSMDVDLGVLVRDAGAASPRGREWLDSVEAGLGVPTAEPKDERTRLLEISAADGATLTVNTRKRKTTQTYSLNIGEASARGASADRDVRLEVVHPGRTWVHVTVKDEKTGKPIPARVHFSGPNGEYYAPYGHHTVINDCWFEDYGADIKLGQMSYAYVAGKFQTNLPVGEVYVEATKGFEYQPVRQKIEIKPGQRALELSLRRWSDWRSEGWVTADTHVHFISPHTAWLQGQSEGLNLINLLASQWGRLFTNAGDITGEVGVEKDDTMVWVGTENRNHMLGHISMLGTHGEPVYPMCCGGPSEAYIGDPDERAMAEWADECRRKEGVVIRPHFPGPNLENPVDIVLGKFDGLELRSFDVPASGPLDAYCLTEYYRYLNCGYRVACVGGTDKMSAGMPVGGVRTYARLDTGCPFDFKNWGDAVRAGRTFSSSGPLIDLKVEGSGMGEEIALTGGAGTVQVTARAECAWPIHRLELVMNGAVVAEATAGEGARKLELREKVPVKGSCWFAARCGSNLKVQHCWPIFVAAHTSPVYVVVPGTELFSPSDATYMLTLIDGGLTYLDTLSVKYDEKRHREMKAIFQHAKEHLEGRMHHH